MERSGSEPKFGREAVGGACLVALVIGAEGFWAMIGVGVEAREIVPASRLGLVFQIVFQIIVCGGFATRVGVRRGG